jgi:hypothetical protein
MGDFGGHWRCSCPEGAKKYVCIHAVAAMVNEKILTFPQAVKESSAVEGLRKKGRTKDNERGRPPKAPKQRGN